MISAPPLGLVTVMSHASKVARAEIEVVALRRPEVVLRRTRYAGLIVDERLLTKAYPWRAPPSRLQVIVLTGGTLRARDLTLSKPGETILMSPELQAETRFESAAFLEIEWTSSQRDAALLPSRLAPLEPDARADLALLFDEIARGREATRSHREIYEQAFALFRSIGAPLGDLDAARLSGGPTERDLRIARAIEAQLASLATSADARSLGELADLSPRQLQRVLTDFTSRYGINAGAWRETRNRWRIQIAVVLLSDPEASVAGVASEVGYRSAPALARAFAAAGFPPPTEVRRLLLQGGT